MGNTVITSYIVDCYPLQSMSVITFYSVFLNLSAFIDPVSHLFRGSRAPTDNALIVLHCTLASSFRLDMVLCGAGDHHLLRFCPSPGRDPQIRSKTPCQIW